VGGVCLPVCGVVATLASPIAARGAGFPGGAAVALQVAMSNTLLALVLPLLFARNPAPAPLATANLTYRGGPVLAKATVYIVFWGANVQFAAKLGAFYSAALNSVYYDWLHEYDTQTTKIGRGVLGGSVVDSAAPAGTQITDAQIQTEVAKLIDTGKITAPDANSLYMVHFPPGVTINDGQGGSSCNQFCAYHGSFTHNGKSIYYGVIPDQGGACSQGCAGDPDLFKDTTAVASHELVEATTDPDINAPAWYDDQQGEIGDICVGQLGSAVGYTVQLEWSNKQGACIDHGPAVPSAFTLTVTPATQTVAAGSSAQFNLATTGTAGPPEDLSFTVSGVPVGARATFDKTSAMTGTPVTLTIATDGSAAASSASIAITATGSASATASVTLTITPSSGSGGTGGVGGGGGNGASSGGGSVTQSGGCSLGGSDVSGTGFALTLLVAATCRRLAAARRRAGSRRTSCRRGRRSR
jgi:hypothetical protein